MKHKPVGKCVLVLVGIMLGIECLGSKRNLIDIQMSNVEMAIIVYMTQEGKFPDSLDVLIQRRYNLKKEDLLDPWGEPFGYEYNEHRYVIWSSGPDKKMGTADDVFKGFPPSYVECWRIKQLGTNAVQHTMQTPSVATTVRTKEEQARREEEALREVEYLMQAVEEGRRARRVYLRTVAVGGAALLLGLCGAGVFCLIRKRKGLKKAKR